MLRLLIIACSIISIDATSCSCALGYRNGAQASDTNLCMGPSEGGRRPCYPRPCNADWTACSNGAEEDSLWTKDSSHTGKRPDCPFVKISDNGQNYAWQNLNNCKKKCIDEIYITSSSVDNIIVAEIIFWRRGL